MIWDRPMVPSFASLSQHRLTSFKTNIFHLGDSPLMWWAWVRIIETLA